MSQFLKRILLFLLFALIGYCLFLPLWSNVIPFEAAKKNMNYKLGGYGYMNTRLKEVESIESPDILVMGSSHAYRGFDPRVFNASGITLFNLGSSNQTPLQALSLLKIYVDQIKPKLVIYEVYPGIFGQDGVESSLDIIANGPLHEDLLTLALKQNHLKIYNVLINHAFRESLGLNNSFMEAQRKPDDHDLYITGGYVQKDDDYIRDQKVNGTYLWNVDHGQWKAFTELLSLLKEKDISLLLVQSPVDQQYLTLNKNKKELDSMFSTMGDYINFNDLMSLDYKEDLYDLHHLKQSGVNKFNKMLIEEIKKRGYLK